MMKAKQTAYLEAKASYEVAIETNQFENIEELEDQLLDAEFELFDYFGELAVETGKLSKEDVETLRRNSTSEQWEKIIDMAARAQ